MAEKKIVNLIIESLCNRGFLVTVVNQGLGRFADGSVAFFSRTYPNNLTKGHPDLIAAKGEQVFYIEVKADPTKKLSQSQVIWAELAKKHAGIDVHVIKSKDDLRRFLSDKVDKTLGESL